MRAVVEYGTPLVEDPAHLEGVASIGVDETSFLAANRFHHTEFITRIPALPGPGRPQAQLLDVTPGRTRRASRWLSSHLVVAVAPTYSNGDAYVTVLPRRRGVAFALPAGAALALVAGALMLATRDPAPGVLAVLYFLLLGALLLALARLQVRALALSRSVGPT